MPLCSTINLFVLLTKTAQTRLTSFPPEVSLYLERNMWKQIFTREEKGRGKEKASTPNKRPLSALPLSRYTDSYAGPSPSAAPPPAHLSTPSDTSTISRYELPDTDFISPSMSASRQVSVLHTPGEAMRDVPEGPGLLHESIAAWAANVTLEGCVLSDTNSAREDSVLKERSIAQEVSTFVPRHKHQSHLLPAA